MRYEGKIWDEHVAQQLVQRCEIGFQCCASNTGFLQLQLPERTG
jgi:hypothetical protein